MENLEPNKLYSARKTMQFFPFIKNEIAMRKFIHQDMADQNILKTITIRSKKQTRYFIKGSNILQMLKFKKK